MMRLFAFRSLIALACVALSAAVSSTAQEKISELEKRSAESSLIDFNTGDYNKFLAGSNREYGVFVLFTASDPKFGCHTCKAAYDDLKLTADNFRRAKSSTDNFFFAVFDFGPGTQKVFMKHEIASAPLFWYFPPKGKVSEGDKMGDLTRKGPSLEAFTKFVRDRSGVEFAVKRPVNWANVGIMVTVFGGIGTLAYFFTPVGLIMRFAKPLLTLVAMGCTLVFPTGHMWNQIRGAGMYTRGPNGETEVWAKGSGNQTVTETYALALLHGVFAICVILLINAPRFGISKPVAVPAGLFALAFLAGAVVLESIDWYLYRTHKNQGYPYSLLL